MTGLPMLPLSRRSLLAGAAGSAALFAAPAAVRAQALAPPQAGPAGGGQSAVIDVNRARTDPIPIAIPTLGGGDGNSAQLGQDIATVVTNDLARSGLFRPIAQQAFIQAGAGQGDAPNFQNWKAIGAQALVTGRAEAQGGGQIRVEFRLWDVLPQTQIQGTAYTTSQANWRRIAHIIADVIYERLLGEKGYFDTRIVYIAATGPRGRQTKRLAIMDQDSENNRFLTDGSWLVLTPRFHPTRDEIAFMSYANNRPRVYLFNLGNGQQRALGDFPGMTFAPRFSPDGSSVVMSVATGGGSDIVSVDLGSHASRRLTNSGAIDVSPCYSPDGSQIVFNSDRGGDQQLYVMGAGGGGGEAHQLRLRPLCHAGLVAARRPDRLHPLRRRIRQLLDRRDAPGRLGRAHPVGGVLGRGPDLRAQRPRADVLARKPPRATIAGRGFSSRLVSVDITGFNERVVGTPTDASDPAWSPLAA